jgi:4-diphosphocytidyl-2-C-methyl-D-erythritol kinase
VLAEVAAPRPTSIVLRKSIPVGAGLGGGSADAAAALTALALSWEARIDAGRLVRLGAEVGSDVPPILVGGLVAVSGRGTDVRRIGSPEAWFVLGVSHVRLSAGDVYAALDALGPPPTGLVRPRLEHNDLEVAASSLSPAAGDGLEALRAAGGRAVFVSGSGPTVVAACASEPEARSIAASAGPAFRRTVVCRASPWGVRLALRGRPATD